MAGKRPSFSGRKVRHKDGFICLEYVPKTEHDATVAAVRAPLI